MDLSPGDLAALRVFPTPAGDLGVAISLDAFRPDVIGSLAAQGCTVLAATRRQRQSLDRQGRHLPGGQTPRDQPLAWLESSWQVTHQQQIRYAVNPMVVGNLLDLTFDGQSAITGPDAEGLPPRSYALTPPRGGFLALLPWVADGPPEQLRQIGRQLAAHSGHPRENAYLSGVVHADLMLPPQTLTAPPSTPHEQALRAFLRGQARLPPSPLRWGWALVAALMLGAGALLRRR